MTAYLEKCRLALDTALSIPAYKDWRKLDPGPSCPIDHRYSSLPSTTKKELRQFVPDGFIPEGRDVKAGIASGEIEFVTTSGTTEERLQNIWNETWWEASERASWQLNSYAAALPLGKHREALLTSPLSTGILCESGCLPMKDRILDRFLYLNEKPDTAGWTPEHMDRIADELAEFQPTILEANPSLLAILSRHIAETGRSVYQPPLIVLSFEFPSRLHYRQVARAFPNVPIMSSHGSTETGCVLTECEEGRFHQNTEFCRIDFRPLKQQSAGSVVGGILVTPFGNEWFSLLRFDVGDLVRMSDPGRCPCGREDGFVFSSIEGRLRDITVLPDGRIVTLGQLDLALSRVAGLFAYRLEQNSPGSFSVQLVADPGVDRAGVGDAAQETLRCVYGRETETTLRIVRSIAPETSGKYRLAQMTFPFDYDSLVDAGAENKPLL